MRGMFRKLLLHLNIISSWEQEEWEKHYYREMIVLFHPITLVNSS